MVIDFQQTLNDVYGKPLPNDAEGAPTLARVAVQALLGEKPGEAIPATKKIERWALATQIAQSAYAMGLTLEQVVEIKDRIATLYGPAIVGAAFDLIDKHSMQPTLGSGNAPVSAPLRHAAVGSGGGSVSWPTNKYPTHILGGAVVLPADKYQAPDAGGN
jgi:hypothetical protein